jgi:ATP-dependent Zn protease
LSRFAEQVEIPLLDEMARRALLYVFLNPMRFTGNRARLIVGLAQATEGQSGRDLRQLVNQGVLAAVKRTTNLGLTASKFTLEEGDFEP